MSGFVGSPSVQKSRCAAENTPIYGLADEAETTISRGGITVFARTPTADTHGTHFLEDGGLSLFVYGAIGGNHWRSRSESELVQSFFEEPALTITRWEGTFLVVAINDDDGRVLVATDKLGAHSCYFVMDQPVFSTTVAACLPFVATPTIDEQSVSDFLLMGHLWGTRTLVSEVFAARPATVYEFDGDAWVSSRYWKPSYDEAPVGEAYLDELATRFTNAVERTASTLPAHAGIWLSGGLDSRNTSSVLRRVADDPEYPFESLTGYTYDANPPTGDNIRIARKIASRLGIDLTELNLQPSSQRIERLVDVCDGMVAWITTKNLSGSYDVTGSDVLMEGVEGSLMGDHLLQSHFTNFDSVVESQLSSEATHDTDLVETVLAIDVDPLRTFRDEAVATNETMYHHKVLDVHFRNYYNRLALASNAVMRDVGGDRVVYTDGEFLEWCAAMPTRYRKGAFPFTNSIPTGTSRAKLGLTRRISPGLSDITYERTKLPPKWPYEAHVCGFVANVGMGRLRSKPTYGNGQLADFWLRMDTEVADWTKEYLERAANRDVFSDDVTALWDQHQRGKNLSPIISNITTLEYWFDKHL